MSQPLTRTIPQKYHPAYTNMKTRVNVVSLRKQLSVHIVQFVGLEAANKKQIEEIQVATEKRCDLR
jgi:hypothetical protein